MGCEVNILRITEYIKEKYKREEHNKLWTIFIDLKSAFDTVDHQILFNKMEKLEIDEEVRETI